MIKFGTDGIRGKFGEDLTLDIAYKIGNALKGNIIIGQDTRASGKELSAKLIQGASDAGNSITYIGVCPTAGIAYLTQSCNFDYGVVITASHNPSEYNGIKLFSGKGLKISPEVEQYIEKQINSNDVIKAKYKGPITYSYSYVNEYKKFLQKSISAPLNDIHIVLDCANGASSTVAPSVFYNLGARVSKIGCEPNGQNINDNCGSTHIENLQNEVIKKHAQLGFAFDGDGDRLIAVDEKGNVIDGDMLLYMLALDYKKHNKLGENPQIVGTIITNLGIEKALNSLGINLIRTNVGDKYVSAELENKDLVLGAEQSGHILLKDKLSTGDGILSALAVAEICALNNKKLSEFFNFDLYEQTAINVEVKDKDAIFNCKQLQDVIIEQKELLGDLGRIIVRKSGTEPVIRVMVESENEQINKLIANEIKTSIIHINESFNFNSLTYKNN